VQTKLGAYAYLHHRNKVGLDRTYTS